MSTALLDAVVKKNRARLIPFMLALYVLAFLDRSNIGFAKQTYQIDTGLSNEAYALGAGVSGGSGESFDAQTGGQNLDWYDNTAVGISFGCHGMGRY